MDFVITSSQNPKIKGAARLWKRSERENTGLFLIEGYRELTRALQPKSNSSSCLGISPIEFEMLFVCPELFLGTNEHALIEKIEKKGVKVFYTSRKAFTNLSYRDRPDGLIAVAKQFHRTLLDLSGSFFIIAEKIEKPGNLGTILRSADGAKADGVIVADRLTDIHNPNVVRASVGTLFTVPVVETDLESTLEWLFQNRITIVAATPHAELPYTDAILTGPLAIVVGTEQYGLSQTWLEKADYQVKIPMLGQADSLNVAMAATLLMYEARRQRDLSR